MQHLGPNELSRHSDALLTRGGAVVAVRFAGPADAEALQAYFRGLSQRSRYNRLMGAASELPAGQLEAFTHPGDDGRFSVLATIDVDGAERVIGEARYALDEEARLELGLSIADAWQRRGLGLALMANLEHRAAALGAGMLVGDTLRSNDAMLALAKKAGFSFAPIPGDWKQMRFEKRIDPIRRVGKVDVREARVDVPTAVVVRGHGAKGAFAHPTI